MGGLGGCSAPRLICLQRTPATRGSEDVNKATKYLDPVAQSIVSLTSSLRDQLVKCFTAL